MNPVLAKDLIGLLRLKRVAAIQLAFIAAIALLVLSSWPQGGVLTLAARQQDNLLLGLIVGQMLLLILFVPGMAAVSISGEKEANTLEMLYASRLSPAQIIWGKLAAAISFPMLLLISALPFTALLSYRGEIVWGQLLIAYVVLIVSAVLLAVLSLTISVLCRQSATSLVISYLAVLFFCGGVLIPAALMFTKFGGFEAALLHYGRSISPVAAALAILRPALGGFGQNPQGLPPSHVIFLPTAAAIIAGCVGVLIAKLRRPPSAGEHFGGTPESSADRTIARRLLVLIDPKKQRRPLGRLNPLLAKERRTSNLRSGRWSIRIFYASLVLSFALSAMSLYGGVENQDLLAGVAQVLAAFQIGLIALVTPSLTSAAISSEIENNCWEMLRLARLRGGQIFWGKFLPAFLPAILPILALLPAWGVLCYVNESYLQYVLRLAPVAAVAVAACCSIGLACSSFTANTARATVTAYLLTAGLFVLPLLAWLASGVQLDAATARWLCVPSPLVMSLAQLPDAAKADPALFEMWSTHLWLMGGLCVSLLVISRIRLALLLRRG